MAKYKIVHYLNQFFGGIGGEDKADFQPEVREEIIGPGMALNDGLGDDYEIVATVICGDNYFGENLDKATDTIVEMVKKYEPDIFVAGPAFNAGRYGVACGTITLSIAGNISVAFPCPHDASAVASSHVSARDADLPAMDRVIGTQEFIESQIGGWAGCINEDGSFEAELQIIIASTIANGFNKLAARGY